MTNAIFFFFLLHSHFGSDNGEERTKKHQDEGIEQEQLTRITDDIEKDVSSQS